EFAQAHEESGDDGSLGEFGPLRARRGIWLGTWGGPGNGRLHGDEVCRDTGVPERVQPLRLTGPLRLQCAVRFLEIGRSEPPVAGDTPAGADPARQPEAVSDETRFLDVLRGDGQQVILHPVELAA